MINFSFKEGYITQRTAIALNQMLRWINQQEVHRGAYSEYPTAERIRVKLTASNGATPPVYTATEQSFTIAGAEENKPNGRTFGPSGMKIYEANGRNVSASELSTGYHTWIERRTLVDGTPYYEFNYGISSSSTGTELKDLTFTSDTDSTADSDPGSGLFKWNNATEASATFLYFSDTTLDSVVLTAYFESLKIACGGWLRLQQYDDSTRWQEWKFKPAIIDAGAYWKFPVTYLAGSANPIQDGKTVLCEFKPPGGFSGARVTQDAFEIPDNALTAIEWEEVFDSESYFDAGSPTRLTCPTDGIYDIAANVSWETTVGSIAIYLNGTTLLTSPASYALHVKNYPASAGDYFQVAAFQNSGVPVDVENLSADALWFSIERIGAIGS